MSARHYACEDCSWEGVYPTGREAMWHADEHGHATYDVATRKSAEKAARTPLEQAQWSVTAEEEATIRARHRHYAMNQLREKAAQMSRDFDRDVAAGKLEGAALIRAHARVMSYTDLVTTLTKLKGLI